ncbi:hypothetical protein ACE38V_13580 [Cytobacillus sp. Hz8]|uniref:hypothetical protein n=1 Tax=Cytobacillus sp. Hz8 TaxID=3347168 RepID=UPI0035DB4226
MKKILPVFFISETAWRNRGYWQINGEEEIKNESSSWSGCFKRGKSGSSIFR